MFAPWFVVQAGLAALAALAAGRGCRLKHHMSQLVSTLREELPKAFRQEAFDKEKAQLKEKYVAQAQTLTAAVEARARSWPMKSWPASSSAVV